MDLNTYRERIDAVDAELLRLFAERMALAEKIGAWKRARGLPVLDANRERQKLDRIAEQSPEGLRAESRELFEKLMELSRRIQERGDGEKC